MVAKWTAERNERFFLLVIQDVRLNYEKLSKEWKERYGDKDEFQPTARALQEQYKTLCKRAGVAKGRGGTTTTPNATPKSNMKKPALPKTPSSGTKRGNKAMSDDDDSEAGNTTPSGAAIGKRAKYDRTSKTPKVHQDPGSDHEAADDEADGKDAKAGLGIFDQELNLDGTSERESGGFTGRRRKMLDEDAMSDVSDFKPELDGFY